MKQIAFADAEYAGKRKQTRRVHLMQNWFGYSDPAMEESLYETTILRHFAGLNLDRIPDETTILNFRRLLETQRPSRRNSERHQWLSG